MAEEKTTDTVLDEQTEQPTSEEATGEPEPTVEEVSAEGDEGGEPAAETDEQESDTAQATKGEKKNPFKKKEKKKDKRDERIEELTDQVKRQMAEFENFRKRTEKEKAGMYAVGAKDVIEKILPVVDNFERGLDVAEDKEDPFVQGMEKIYKQFLSALDGMGVKAIEAVGNEFNPDFHNAVMHVEDETVGENIIVEEFQKGYMYKDSVIRHSMVKVAN